MAVPKRKTSKAKTRSRKANWKLCLPGMTACSNCGEVILSHRVCKHCGSYAGKTVIKEEA
ncbi:MAG: 50S ribosomal protein L32 [Oscillospiraceae bacterium]|nr:50S ribosomal protein L32 [Oscillospiraceae bacterium]